MRSTPRQRNNVPGLQNVGSLSSPSEDRHQEKQNQVKNQRSQLFPGQFPGLSLSPRDPLHAQARVRLGSNRSSPPSAMAQPPKQMSLASRRRRNCLYFVGVCVLALLLIAAINPDVNDADLEQESRNEQIEVIATGKITDSDDIRTVFCQERQALCGQSMSSKFLNDEQTQLLIDFKDVSLSNEQLKTEFSALEVALVNKDATLLRRYGISVLVTRLDGLERRTCTESHVGSHPEDTLCGHERPIGGCTSPGKVGAMCDTCISNYYGSKCVQCSSCIYPRRCFDGITGDGTCSKCSAGFDPSTGCSECLSEFYGAVCVPCRSDCPNGCNDGQSGDGSCRE